MTEFSQESIVEIIYHVYVSFYHSPEFCAIFLDYFDVAVVETYVNLKTELLRLSDRIIKY